MAILEHKWWINFNEATAKFGVLSKAGEISLLEEGLRSPKIAWKGDLKKVGCNQILMLCFFVISKKCSANSNLAIIGDLLLKSYHHAYVQVKQRQRERLAKEFTRYFDYVWNSLL